MRRQAGLTLLCAWLLVHPYYSEAYVGPWVKLWDVFWYRNTRVAVMAFDNQEKCMTTARRSRTEAATELGKESLDRDSLLRNLAWVDATCVPADALGILPYKVITEKWFGVY
jgi:hypothetical protein